MVTVKDDNPPASVQLKYILDKNGKYKYKLISETTSQQTITADSTMTMSVKEIYTYILDCNVKDIDQDSVIELSVVFSSIKVNAESGNQTFEYESGKTLDSAKMAHFVQFEAFLNNPFSVRISPEGEIIELFRTDKIINKFVELQKAEGKVTPEQKVQVQTNINETLLKPIVQQIFRRLPTQTVSANSKWDDSKPTKLEVFDVMQKVDYSISGFEKMKDDRLAVINSSLTMTAQGKDSFTERGIKYNFSKPKAEGTGTIYFNISKGYIQKSESHSRVESGMSMQAPQGVPGPKKASKKDVVISVTKVQLL